VRQWITGHDREQFRAEGHMVIRNVVPERITRNAVRDIAAFIGADLADSSTWYGPPPELDGVVPMHHAQSLWDIRQCPNLYQLFTEFFGTPRLMLDINRCLFRPPVPHGTIHWDADPRGLEEPSVQAVVLLTDVIDRDGGGFQCLPEIYRNLNAWLGTHGTKNDFNFFEPGLNHLQTTQIAGQAGDVILWSTLLPHGSAANLSDRPRMAAFVTLQPPADYEQLRNSLMTWWLTKRAPEQWRGMPGQLDPEPGAPAALSELGQKLIGARPW